MVLGFPNPVNEKAARIVASGVVVLAVTTLLLSLTDARWLWLAVVLAAGFWARVLTGPRLSPLGRFAVWLAPRFGAPKLVAGPPKRFAQGLGAAITTGAVLALALGATGIAAALVAAVALAAFGEAAFGFCVGCKIFGLGIRLGWVPEETCAACSDIAVYREAAKAASGSTRS